MHPVGRLDADTTGLLLFSADGKLTQALLNPNSKIPRIYDAYVENEVNHAKLLEQLAAGVKTTDGNFPALLLESHVLTLEVILRFGCYLLPIYSLSIAYLLPISVNTLIGSTSIARRGSVFTSLYIHLNH